MPRLPTPLAVRRSDLVLRPMGRDGGLVVREPRSGTTTWLDPDRAFLLLGLDGSSSADALRARFAERFGTPLSAARLDAFLALARRGNWLESAGPSKTYTVDRGHGAGVPRPRRGPGAEDDILHRLRRWPLPGAPSARRRGRLAGLLARVLGLDANREHAA